MYNQDNTETPNNRLERIRSRLGGIRSSNYAYDPVGNLVWDEREGFEITWTAAGKVKSVTGNGRDLNFNYSPLGQRQKN